MTAGTCEECGREWTSAFLSCEELGHLANHDVPPESWGPFVVCADPSCNDNTFSSDPEPWYCARHRPEPAPPPPTDEDAPDSIQHRRVLHLRSRLRGPDQIRDMQDPPPLVPKWLSMGTLGVIYGPPKGFKSLVLQDLANSMATARPWLNREARAGSVLYVIGEGAGGLGKRLRAWEEFNGTAVEGVHYLPGPINLLDEQVAVGVADLAADLMPNLVCIDTIARCMYGGDENSTRDMGRMVAALDLIREKSGACVVGVHHTGKDETKGMRGSSALLGAVDTAIAASRSGDFLTLKAEAQRDLDTNGAIQAHMVKVLDSVVLEPVEAAAGEKANPNTAALDALRAIFVGDPVSTTVWFDSSGIPKTSFYRYRAELLADGLVIKVGKGWRPTTP